MNPIPPSQDIERLAGLAMSFRATRRAAERERIAAEYAQAVDRLIDSGRWTEIPPPEDQLPDDCMPQAFFDFWLRREAAS